MLTNRTVFSAPSVATNDMVIRPATLNDAQQISALVSLGEREGQLLPRSLDSIRASIGDWLVAEVGGRVVGCGSLVEMGPTLVEVRSLAVAPEYRNNGVGAEIVNALVDKARARGIPNVFALTRAVAFFEKRGFVVSTKQDFPEKVWRDCAICPVQNACDEIAVVKTVVT